MSRAVLLVAAVVLSSLPAAAQTAICLDYPASRTEYHNLEQAHRALLDSLLAAPATVELGAVVRSARGSHLVLPLTAVAPAAVDAILAELAGVPDASRRATYTGASDELGGCAKLLGDTSATERAVIQPIFLPVDEARSVEWIRHARTLFSLGITLHLVSPNPIDPDQHAQIACSTQAQRVGTTQRVLRSAGSLAKLPGLRNLVGGAAGVALDEAAKIAEDGQEVLKSVKGIRAKHCRQLVHSRPFFEALPISAGRVLGSGR